MGKIRRANHETATRLDIYQIDQILNGLLRQIQENIKNKSNLELIIRYDNLMTSLSLSKATRNKNLSTVYHLTKFNNDKDWKNFTRTDAESVIAHIMRTYSDDGQETNTTFDFKKILKIFVRWVAFGSRDKRDVGDPDSTKWIKIKKVRDRLARENLLTKDDITKLLQVTRRNPMYYAMFDVLYEAGARPGEVLNMKIKHVVFDDNGALIRVDGKTGARPIRLLSSAKSLADWINAHPLKNNAESPLWIMLDKKNFGKAITYQAANKQLKRKGEEANLGKRIFLNLFRHSEATRAATWLTDNEMRIRHGWTSDSKMASRYTHLTQSDLDKKILQHHGIIEEEKKDILFKICPICKTKNHTDVDYCQNCTKPLELKTALDNDIQIVKENDELKNNVAQLTNDIRLLKDSIMTQSRSMELLKAFLLENPEQVQNLGKAELTHNMKLLRAFLLENPEQVQNLGKNENK